MGPTTPDQTSTALLEAARALGSEIRASADQIERDRKLPRPLFEAMAAAGLFKMLVPRSLGGGEVDPATLLRVISEVARADGSAGWCVFVSTLGVAAGTLREDVAQEIWGHD